MNQLTIQGNVGTDPEIKFVKDNLALATFSLAHTPRTQKNGKWEDGETMWFKVAQFGAKAEAVVDLVKKGDTVIVMGSVKQVSYKGRDGQEKQGLEINASSVSVIPKMAKKREADLPTW